MEFYELAADKKDFFIFDYRCIVETCPHFHGSVEILFVERGEQKVIIDGETRVLKRGEGCFSDSFSVHSYVVNPEAMCYILIADKGIFNKILNAYSGKIPPVFFKFDNFKLLNELMKLCNFSYKKQTDLEIVREGALRIVLSWISENNELICGKKSRSSMLVKDILIYAENNLSSDLSLGALSKQFNYSKEHLSRLLHKYLAENWSSYTNRLRVKRAYDLIENNPELSVMDIAFECGYESVATFYRAYKNEYGKAPRQERIKDINF